MTISPNRNSGSRRACVIGTGLIGGSIALGLRRRGWWVCGTDLMPGRAERALEIGVLDEIGGCESADVTFVAVPAGAVAKVAEEALGSSNGIVTDVAGVKAPIVEVLSHPRFVGGHPMAGSEQEGVDGANPDLFIGAAWVLTPGEVTDPDAYGAVREVAMLLGANPIAVDAKRHDELVALVSHVPHLTAATLMNLAARSAVDDAALLRLAAGGFRDMTRVASGHPGIWPDVVSVNRDAIVRVLDRLQASIADLRSTITAGDSETLVSFLESAREARVNLPVGAPALIDVCEIRVPVQDRPGVLAEVTSLLGSLGVNIFDLEIAHSGEGPGGVLVVTVESEASAHVMGALQSAGHRPSVRSMGG